MRTPIKNREACKRYYDKKVQDPEYRVLLAKRVRVYRRKLRKLDLRYFLLQGARQRAKKRGRPCTIKIQDIVIPKYCPYLGFVLKCALNSSYSPFSPTLDEIIPGRGYIPGNIEVISRQANTMKSNASPSELVRMAKVILERWGSYDNQFADQG